MGAVVVFFQNYVAIQVPNLSIEQTVALQKFSVHVDNDNNAKVTVADLLNESGLHKLYTEIYHLTDAPSHTVAASVYMRKHGLLLASQLHFISEYNTVWTGELCDISICVEQGTLFYSLPSYGFKQIESHEKAIRFILESYGHIIVEHMSKQAKIAKLILWENVWGYVLWMYTMLLENNSNNAQDDLTILLADETWKPAMRRSPFKQYLNNQQALDAMVNYKRITCCLYKELPHTEKCPYCPLRSKKSE